MRLDLARPLILGAGALSHLFHLQLPRLRRWRVSRHPSQGTLTNRVIRGRTGRSGYAQVHDVPTAYQEVQKFVLELCSEDRPRNWLLLLLMRPIALCIAWQAY